MASDNTEHIERYLAGELNDAEKTAFEQQLKSDGNLHQEYMVQKELQKGIESRGRHQLLEELDVLHDEFLNEGLVTHKKATSLRYVLSGIVATLVLGMVYWNFQLDSEIDQIQHMKGGQEVEHHVVEVDSNETINEPIISEEPEFTHAEKVEKAIDNTETQFKDHTILVRECENIIGLSYTFYGDGIQIYSENELFLENIKIKKLNSNYFITLKDKDYYLKKTRKREAFEKVEDVRLVDKLRFVKLSSKSLSISLMSDYDNVIKESKKRKIKFMENMDIELPSYFMEDSILFIEAHHEMKGEFIDVSGDLFYKSNNVLYQVPYSNKRQQLESLHNPKKVRMLKPGIKSHLNVLEFNKRLFEQSAEH